MDLGRFVEAQDRIWPVPLTEIRSGRKVTHWSWFVMPQVRGLGRSHLAHHYAIQGLDHARAYLAHAVLGPRLIETCGAMLALGDTTAERVLGGIDALKLQSCATLFEAAGEPPSLPMCWRATTVGSAARRRWSISRGTA